MKKFTKSDIKTGMFGVMSDGEGYFVVVDDLIVYQDGGYDEVHELDENLSLRRHRIEKLYEGVRSFAWLDDVVEHGCMHAVCVYDREYTHTHMTISEIEKALGIKNLKIIEEEN